MTHERPTCQCGGEMVGYGRRSSSVLVLVDARIKRMPIETQRFKCKECQAIHTPMRRGASDTALTAIISAVQQKGVLGASQQLECDRSVIDLVFRKWLEAKNRHLSRTLPDTIGIHVFSIGNDERIMVSDLAREKLVEVFEDHASMAKWFAGMEGRPSLVAIDVDARSRRVVEEKYAEAQISVGANSAEVAVERAACASLRAMQKDEPSRNYREQEHLLTKSDNLLTADEQDEMGNWSGKARNLRRITVDVTTALRGEPGVLKNVMDRGIALLRKAGGTSPLLNLLTTWAQAFLVGCQVGWADDSFLSLLSIAHKVNRYVQRVRFDVLRSVLLLSSGDDAPMRRIGRIVESTWGWKTAS